MRPFEILILLSDTIFLLWIFPQRRRWINFLPLAAVVFIVAHLLIEGYRWQMIPAYAFTFVALLISIVRVRNPSAKPTQRRIFRIAGFTFGLVALLIATALPLLLPVFQFPLPTGQYKIGTTSYYWVDKSRTDAFANEPPGPRELMVQVWYPTEANGPTVSYIDHANTITPVLAQVLGLPSFSLQNLNLVQSHAVQGTPISATQSSYPILIFLAGRGGIRQQNTFQVEELASHGYVVVGIDQPYASAVSVFPDGRTAMVSINDWPLNTDPAFDQQMSDRVTFLARDVTFVLDQLEILNSTDSILKGKLNLDKIGVFGHSLGGSVAVRACQLDNRLKAGIDMDAPLFGSAPTDGLKQPFMFMSREQSSFQRELAHVPPKTAQEIIDKEYNTIRTALTNSDAPGYFLTIKGVYHYDFTDLSLWSPLTSVLGITGSISAARAHQIIDTYTLAFFDTYFRGDSSNLLAGNSANFPEVNLTVFRSGTP